MYQIKLATLILANLLMSITIRRFPAEQAPTATSYSYCTRRGGRFLGRGVVGFFAVVGLVVRMRGATGSSSGVGSAGMGGKFGSESVISRRERQIRNSINANTKKPMPKYIWMVVEAFSI